ncbi:hypothetical protein [Saccharopolyspora dendranthemae]|uniref:Uncharacterized protein n=1 Tax=Saccharopolyspora dendranthemae TaxID=1181886 RepID=A0A561U221_9PSEU|nr:hypothetical protein [Saccharopolyspora dendranthemae]TWF93370.1 hypothetical protein FHU35_15214 [Saccharopolyspora dendranthemae]
MAKNAFPMMPKAGGGVMPKLIGFLVLFAVGSMIIKQPVESATVIGGLWTKFAGAGDALATFLQAIGG